MNEPKEVVPEPQQSELLALNLEPKSEAKDLEQPNSARQGYNT